MARESPSGNGLSHCNRIENELCIFPLDSSLVGLIKLVEKQEAASTCFLFLRFLKQYKLMAGCHLPHYIKSSVSGWLYFQGPG